MIDFTIETEIDRRPAAVFAYIGDPDKLPTRQTNTVSVEQLKDGPLGVGTRLREVFFEKHNPTKGMRQGSEVGTWNRSGIYFVDDTQKATAEAMLSAYDEALRAAGHDPITTEVEPATTFYYAEDDDQQYLHKRPNAIHCALVGTGVSLSDR